MQHAETVTFGGSGLDRAAHLRHDPAALRQDPRACAVVLWRGKPCVDQDHVLMRLPLGHAAIETHAELLIFLGKEEGGAPIFACDLSDWTPADFDETAMRAFVDPTVQSHPLIGGGFHELRRIMTLLSPRDAELAATARAMFDWHRRHGFCAACGAPTVMGMAGWQRACPSCHAPHFPRTDPVVIVLATYANHVLLGRSPGWPEGMYSLLAGFVEPGETIEAAARREVFEEAGVRLGDVRYLASQPWAFPGSLMIGVAAEALDPAITIDPEEIEDAQWISRETLLEESTKDNPRFMPGRKGAIAEFLLRHWLADRLD